MRRALLTAGAILALAAPAFAQSTTTTTTTTKETVIDEPAQSGSTVSTTRPR